MLPPEIFGLPSWVVIIIGIAILIVVGFIIYHYATGYSPAEVAPLTDEPSVTTNFDPTVLAQYANTVFNETTGSDDAALVAKLSALDDNELIEVYNAYGNASTGFFSSNGGYTLTQMLQNLDFIFTSSVPRNNLVARMQAAPLNLN